MNLSNGMESCKFVYQCDPIELNDSMERSKMKNYIWYKMQRNQKKNIWPHDTLY